MPNSPKSSSPDMTTYSSFSDSSTSLPTLSRLTTAENSRKRKAIPHEEESSEYPILKTHRIDGTVPPLPDAMPPVSFASTTPSGATLHIKGTLTINTDQIPLYCRGEQLLVCAHDLIPLVNKRAFNSLEVSKRSAWISNKVTKMKSMLLDYKKTHQHIKQPKALKERIEKEGGYFPDGPGNYPCFFLLNTLEENIKVESKSRVFKAFIMQLLSAYKEHCMLHNINIASSSTSTSNIISPLHGISLASLPNTPTPMPSRLQFEGCLKINMDQIPLYRRGEQLLVCINDFFPLQNKEAFHLLEASKRARWIKTKRAQAKKMLDKPEKTYQNIKQPKSLEESIKNLGATFLSLKDHLLLALSF